jgi:hypothetical protein
MAADRKMMLGLCRVVPDEECVREAVQQRSEINNSHPRLCSYSMLYINKKWIKR